MKHALELLAPAGAWEHMTAAVQNGADAVYLGGKSFSARRFAGNFEERELQHAFDYCHERGVRTYVTFNTLLLDRELDEALQYAVHLYESGADALIVQDMGLIRMVKHALPDFELHASTQMAVHDENGLAICARLGLSRAVLARELSLERIRGLSDSPVELECFAHGALCTSVSGACLFSSLAGGRSGNRGECAQPCRKSYTVEGLGEGYPLSLADLCMLFHADELSDAGVKSIKLEGRMKRPEYVAAMTRAYRMAIDGANEADLRRELGALQRIFSRGAGTGYFYSADVPANARGELYNDEALLGSLRESYRGERRKQSVRGRLELYVGEKARLKLILDDMMVTAQGETVQSAQKAPDEQRYIAQVSRLGDTPFEMCGGEIHMPEPAFVPVSALNALRRDAADALLSALRLRRAVPGVQMPSLPTLRSGVEAEILAVVPDVERAEAAFQAGADIVALEPRCCDGAMDMLLTLQQFRRAGKRLFLQLPAADIAGREKTRWQELFDSGLLDGGVAQNAGQVLLIHGERVAGYLCNAANAQAVAQLQELGFDRVLLSLELNKPQLRDLLAYAGTGLYAYGRAQLMQLWHCPYRREGNCRNCGSARGGALHDDGGRVFPLDPVRMGKECLTRVRNCDTLDILDVLCELPQYGCAALEFVYETPYEVRERISTARAVVKGETPERRGQTRGHWARGLQS